MALTAAERSAKWRCSPKGQAWYAQRVASGAAKADSDRYNQGLKGKETRAKYRKEVWTTEDQKASYAAYVARNPEKVRMITRAAGNKYRASEKGIAALCVYKTTPEYRLSALKAHYKYTYGLTLEQYNAMVAERKGLCDICHLPDRNHKLVVDHDHKTGKNRGLLCRKCNIGIGHLRDDIETLRSAIKYLERRSL